MTHWLSRVLTAIAPERQLARQVDRLVATRARTAARLREQRGLRRAATSLVVMGYEREATLRRERDELRAALTAIATHPKATFEYLEAQHPDVARRINRDDLGTGTGDIIRAAANAALGQEQPT